MPVQQWAMHQCSDFNGVYYSKERENYTINDIHSNLCHVTIVQTLRGWGTCLARECV